MRILLVEKFYEAFGGVGTYLRLAKAKFEARGHHVMQFGCVGPDGRADMPVYHDFAASTRGTDVLRMIHNAQAARRLDAWLRQHPADVAYLQNIYHHLTPSVLPVLKRHRVAVVMRLADYRLACPTKHFLRSDGVCMRCLPNRFWHAGSPRCAGSSGVALAIESYCQRMARRYYRGVDYFICPTRFMRRVMVQAGMPRSKAVLVRNLLNEITLPEDIRPESGNVLYAGRLSPEKGPDLLVELGQRLPDAAITVAGTGPMAEELQADVHRRGLTNVHFRGLVSSDQMPSLLAKASVVVVTSRCFENSPMSMLEAMGAGKCVVVPDHPPLREWVTDGQTGRTFRPDDADDLARVIGEVLSNGPARAAMGAAAEALIAGRHQGGRIIDRLEDLFTQARARCVLR